VLEPARRQYHPARLEAPVDDHAHHPVVLARQPRDAGPSAKLGARVDQPGQQATHQGPAPDMTPQDHPVVGGERAHRARRRLIERRLDAPLNVGGQS
jgi:hypothetical protein